MTPTATKRQPGLTGQIVLVIGGSAGRGLEMADRARAEGADIILTAAAELGALSCAAFDAADLGALERFPGDIPEQMDHVMVTAVGPAGR